MSIAVTCECGKKLRAKDQAAGKQVRCPGCGRAVQVPSVPNRSAANAFESCSVLPNEVAEERTGEMLQFECYGCGKTLSAPKQLAGKKAKCPRCARIVSIPELAREEPETPSAAQSEGSVFVSAASAHAESDANVKSFFEALESEENPGVPPPTHADRHVEFRACPFCGEQIPPNAIKCRHCASMLVPLPTEMSYSPPRTSGLAVASLVLGIVWLCGIGSLLATVFGAVALKQIGDSRGSVTGKGMAIAGLVLGVLGLTLWCLYYTWVLALVGAAGAAGR